eukprot:1158186-Pelagomonas_calceolata.AAC.6
MKPAASAAAALVAYAGDPCVDGAGARPVSAAVLVAACVAVVAAAAAAVAVVAAVVLVAVDASCAKVDHPASPAAQPEHPLSAKC